MFENTEAGKRIERSTSDGQLREEIEAISKALYLDKNSSVGSRSTSMGKTQSPDPKSKNRRDNEDQAQKDKKSIWNWKPLKAFSNRNRRFNCCFTLHVHNIENLPSSLEDQSLSVHWKRRDGGMVTRAAQVFQGMAEFEESLMHSCSVNGSRSGPHNSAKYEAKHFMLYAVISSSPEVDLGKHRVDLTRLLPLSLEELEEDKSSGKWTTSFRLSGKGKGATLNVSFGYLVLGNNGKVPGINPKLLESLNLGKNNPNHFEMNSIRRAESLPNMLNSSQSRAISQELDNVKDLHEVLPERKSFLACRVDSLSQKFEEEKPYYNLDDNLELEVFMGEHETAKSTPSQPPVADESETEVNGFSVIDQGVELSAGVQVVKRADTSVLETRDVVEVGDAALNPITVGGSESVAVVEGTSPGNVVGIGDPAIKEDESMSKEALMRDLESALQNVAKLEVDSLDSPEAEPGPMRVDFAKGIRRRGRSLSYDDTIARDFLDMIGLEHGLSAESEPESPRERLLRQFEEDARASGCSLYDFGIGDDAGTGTIWDNRPENFIPPPVIHVPVEEEHRGESRSRMKAKLLENLETEALMLAWGLNENSFQSSPPSSSGPFGSPIHLPSEEPADLPSLGVGIGPYLQMKNGGFLRSMSQLIFQGAKSGGSLIMQASSPVVVPAQMGSGIMEILNHLASIGIEKLSAQANKLMPIENITGKTMQQVAWEASASLEGTERLTRRTAFVRKGTGDNVGAGTECVSLEDLAPLALDKIEALLMEGLRIQSGMSHEEAPSNIHTQSIGEFSALRGTGINLHGRLLDLEGTGGLQLLLDMKDGDDDDDGLMGLSLSLDEWMKLDSGEINDGDRISERTSRILAAHHANSLDYVRGGSKGDRRRGKSKKCGLLGNNFTVALMVQLRDPMRDYEPVGAPMLALVQVERVFVPPKPTIFREVSEVRCEDENESTVVVKEGIKEENIQTAIADEVVPQFQITEVHVAGFRTVPGKKNSWGTSNQQGSRWLLANGMGKSSRNALMRPKLKTTGPKFTRPATTKAQPSDTLWSISARVLGRGNKWKESSTLNPHIRNPDIILPAENTIKLR
ncbi:hypothetical protein MLD38_006207 [Melastoma candidum]|uniref:Uncharacterized protein n=1 Tax=Melastoma candidum TaxID=119954 RepID=A0ACB9RQ65_9MYRT|nr:hypothetical protein MLD38_006207 [Melastoma candidum]